MKKGMVLSFKKGREPLLADQIARTMDHDFCCIMETAIARHLLKDARILGLQALLVQIYEKLKNSLNCPFCHADLKDKVSPGARRDQKRIHGHPRNCLWLQLKEEVHRAASHRRDVRFRRRRR